MKLKLKKNKYCGKLIVFEGCDGSGKTTLLNYVKDYLQKLGRQVYSTKMPSQRIRSIDIFNDYDKSLDNTIRQTINLENLTVFVSGDRLLVQDLEIVPALKQGKIVLCDRYCYTSLARCNTKLIKSIAQNFIKPDLVIYTKANPQVLKQRVKSRQNEKNDFYDDDDVKNQILIFDTLSKSNNFYEIDTTNKVDYKNLTSAIQQVL